LQIVAGRERLRIELCASRQLRKFRDIFEHDAAERGSLRQKISNDRRHFAIVGEW
jgi:hypothetical protein